MTEQEARLVELLDWIADQPLPSGQFFVDAMGWYKYDPDLRETAYRELALLEVHGLSKRALPSVARSTFGSCPLAGTKATRAAP